MALCRQNRWELGDWVHDAWNAANAVHVGFYDGWATRKQVAEALKKVSGGAKGS
ncbi:MAG: PaREP1 family protein [Thermoproteus sp.]